MHGRGALTHTSWNDHEIVVAKLFDHDLRRIGDEVIHGLLDIMVAGESADRIARTVHVHPTVSKPVPTLLQQWKAMD
jgi:pyruvate/2-oxoglutarate dehydrogenase complex dihydrolipoamide dehydrogenase (E3) component